MYTSGLGTYGLCSATIWQLLAFRATFCGTSNLKQFFYGRKNPLSSSFMGAISFPEAAILLVVSTKNPKTRGLWERDCRGRWKIAWPKLVMQYFFSFGQHKWVQIYNVDCVTSQMKSVHICSGFFSHFVGSIKKKPQNDVATSFFTNRIKIAVQKIKLQVFTLVFIIQIKLTNDHIINNK